MMGQPIVKKKKIWQSTKWQVKTYPMLGLRFNPDRTHTREPRFDYCEGWDREDAANWNAKVWPFPVPRSACICCPYRTNREWAYMRENQPNEFAQAIEFDKVIREAYAYGQGIRGQIAGVPYLHRSLVPLDMVDLSEPLNDRMGCGGLFSQEPDGICGV